MTWVLLFPGQGAQHADMLRWVDDHPLAAAALQPMAQVLGSGWRGRLADATWATSNAVAQVLLTGIGLATWQALAAGVPPPAAVAGYSVGELAACAAAGLFDAGEAVALAQVRAAAMDACASASPGGLLSVGGLGAHHVPGLCERFTLDVAIHAARDRWVLGGAPAALADAVAWLQAQGLDARVLPVAVASHTPRLQAAGDALAAWAAPRPWPAPKALLVMDCDGAEHRTAHAVKAALAAQVARPVQWVQAMDTLGERRPHCALEVGPGTSLARLWRQHHPDIPVRSADDFHSAEAVMQWVNRQFA